jgi:hypothetical protein
LIAGRVVDGDTGAPLVGAMVALRNASSQDRVLTDSLGRFALPYGGGSSLRVLAIGFTKTELELNLSAPEGCYAEIQMVPAVIQMHDDVF